MQRTTTRNASLALTHDSARTRYHYMSYSGHQTTSPLLTEYTEATPLPNDESGARHTVVLVHGFPDNANVWNDTQAHLLSRGYRVVCINLPGFESDTRPFRPLTFAETVERLYRTLQPAEALGGTVIGHDWGAIFLYRLLVAYPDAASQLVTLEIDRCERTKLFVLFISHSLSLCPAKPNLGSKLLAGIYRLLSRPKYNGMPKARSPSWLYKQAWREGSSHGPWPTTTAIASPIGPHRVHSGYSSSLAKLRTPSTISYTRVASSCDQRTPRKSQHRTTGQPLVFSRAPNRVSAPAG